MTRYVLKERERTRPWPCVYCDHVSIGEAEAKRHRNTHPLEERVVVCPNCGKVFRNCGYAYLRHKVMHEELEDFEHRFWSRVHMTSECWEWTGPQNGKGYGAIMWKRKRTSTHRFAYERLVGPIPAGLELDHLCRNRICLRPEHLEPVTHVENTRRGHDANRGACPACGLFTTKGNLVRHMRSKHPSTGTTGDADD